MRITLLYLYMLIFLLLATPLSATRLSTSQQVNITNGLSNNGVTKLFYDSRGYLWIATYDGLNCFNGYSTKVYKNDINHKILPTNRVRTIAEDSSDKLWIGTDNGIVIYDYQRDHFILKDRFERGGIVRHIEIVDDFVYCITEQNGVVVYNTDMTLIRHDKSQLTIVDPCGESILINDKLILYTDKGVFGYNIHNGQYKQLVETPDDKVVKHAMLYGKDRLLLAVSDGIYEYKLSDISNSELSVTFVKIHHKGDEFSQLSIDKEGKIWGGTRFDGVIHLNNLNDDTADRYLANSRISGFRSVDNGDMWISTFDNGVFRFASRKSAFFSPTSSEQLQMPLIDLIDQDRLIITSNKMSFIYNTRRHIYEDVPSNLLDIMHNTGVHVLVDDKGKIWVFCRDSNYYYDPTKDQLTDLEDPRLSVLNNNTPTCVSQDLYGDIWIGCRNGLYRLSIDDNDKIESVESMSQNSYFKTSGIMKVRAVYHDKQSQSLWIGTDSDGLFIVDMSQRKNIEELSILNYKHSNLDEQSISSNFVSSILRTPEGDMWIGTERGGVCRVDESGETLSFTAYTEDDGLSNNVVKSLSCDDQGRLWIATNIGLTSYEPSTDRFHIYRKSDGLPFEEFLYSTVKGDDGRIYLTGASNFCYFSPSDLANSGPLPNLYFSGLNIHDTPVLPEIPYDGRVVIDRRLQSGDNVVLNNDENSFSINVDAIYNDNFGDCHLYYKLSPIDQRWRINDASNNEISFNGVKSGKYTLNIKASNSFGEITPERELYIRIKPPFYNSIGAYIIYIALIIAIVYILMHTQSLRHRIKLEEREKEHIKMLNLEKQRYFSNISHELKTPLTLISAPLSILNDRFKLDQNIRTNLMIMQRQVRKMLQLIDLAHGVQMSDENRLALKPEIFVVRNFLNDIAVDFEFLANFDKKSFKVEYPDAILKVNADYDMLEKVLNNLLNNAFKYTTMGDEIVLTYHAVDTMLTLSVRDNGTGIKDSDLPHIFERYYTSTSLDAKRVGGTGIGLAFSKYMVELHNGTINVDSRYGQGTIFTIELPIIVEQLELAEESPIEVENNERDLIIGHSERLDDDIQIEQELRNKVVYIVEDNSEMRAFISDIMGYYFKFKAFSSAANCLTAMEREWPDIIVSDVMMPDMSGDELCRLIKSDIRTCHIPIILLTAKNTVDDKIKGFELGADDYIGKPFYPKHLITRICAMLRNRQQLRDHIQKGLPIKQTSISSVSSRDSEMLTSLYELFERSLDNEEIELDSFAEKLGLSRSIFFSKIKALTDMSPYELMKNYRLRRAMELLSSGEYNVNETCVMTGFKSRTHFSRIFKEQFGIAPSKVNS